MQAFHTFAAERWFLSVSRREVATELPQTEEKRTARTTTPTTTAESVWSVFGGIAQTTGATNLGQGFRSTQRRQRDILASAWHQRLGRDKPH